MLFCAQSVCQVSQVSALCLDVHDSLGALWQFLAPFGGSEAAAAVAHPRDAQWLRAQLADS